VRIIYIIIAVLLISNSAFAAEQPIKMYSRFGGAGSGNDESVSILDSADFQFGTNDWTIEMWVRFNSVALEAGKQWRSFIRYKTPSDGGVFDFMIDLTSAYSDNFRLNIYCSDYLPSENIFQYVTEEATTPKFTPDTWYHIAAVRDGGLIKVFVNGVSQILSEKVALSVGEDLRDNWASSIGLAMFYGYSGNDEGVRWIDEYRIVNGTAVYTSNFTPPTSPYVVGDEANTKLLLHCDSIPLIDETSNHSPSINGPNVRIDADNYKFGSGSLVLGQINLPIKMYSRFFSSGVYGIFDSDESALTTMDTNKTNYNTGTDAFTIECWVNFIALNNPTIFWNWGSESSRLQFRYYYYQDLLGQLEFRIVASSSNFILACDWNPSLNTWYHVAVSRAGITETDWGLYIDGISQTRAWRGYEVNPWAWSLKAYSENDSLHIGRDSGVGWYANMWMDNFRFSDIARYTSNFDPGIYPVPDPSVDGSTDTLILFNDNVIDGAGNHDTSNINVTFGETEIPIKIYSRDI